jgi:prepilin-type processing-associated H-X9-DG protein
MVETAVGTWPQRDAKGVAAESYYPKGHAQFNKFFRTFKSADIRRSSRTLMIVEAFGTVANPNWSGHATGSLIQTPNSQLGLYPFPTHNKRWNYLLADGHIELLEPVDTVDGDKAKLNTAPPGGMWVRDQG